jgi:hypothetical protein
LCVIELSLPTIHVSNGDHADHLPPDREGNEQVPSATRLSERIVPFFPLLRMADVAANDQRFVEENIFSFLRCDLMPFPILVSIRFVPIEACAFSQSPGPEHPAAARRD